MKRVLREGAERERYMFPRCEGDPLHDDVARKWADSPLNPPAEI
jgi:hypothetical protein